MSNINLSTMLNEAGAIANDYTHGYSQAHRQGPDYDCSSFVAHCLIVAGANIDPGMSTSTENATLVSIGFNEIGLYDTPEPGDIYYWDGDGNKGHTFIVYDNLRLVHASSSKGYPETGDQTQVIDADGYDYSGEICFMFLSNMDLSAHAWHHMRYGAEPVPPGPTPPGPGPGPGPGPEPLPDELTIAIWLYGSSSEGLTTDIFI